MKELLRLSRAEIRHKLNPKELQTTRIIQAIIVAFPVVLLGIILFLHSQGFSGEFKEGQGRPELINLLLIVMAVMTIGILVAARIVPSLMLKADTLAEQANSSSWAAGGGVNWDSVNWMLDLHRTTTIIRLALFEGAALFGLVVLLMAVLGKNLKDNPIAWLSLVPLVIHLIHGVVTFPTKEVVLNFMEQKIIQPLRRHTGSF